MGQNGDGWSPSSIVGAVAPRLQEGERTSAQNAARHTIRSSGGETALASFAPHIGYYSSPSRSVVVGV